MEHQLGTAQRPVRVAIIGAGPSGFYAAGALLGQKNIHVSVDIFDRLPTPFGLVRYGVAPDHEKIKSVIKVYEKTAADSRVRFFGHVNFGTDLTHDAVRQFYDQVIYALGASSDRRLGVPGEDLAGSYSATDFVGWYNCHPDYTELVFDLLNARSVAVVGNGNVAMDIVRILARSAQELAATDIGDHALDVLRHSQIEKIYMLGRRGPAQAAFTNPELRELSEIDMADVIVDPGEIEIDPYSQAAIQTDREAAKNVDTLRQYALRRPQGRPRQILLRFLVSPVELLGENGHVTAVKLEHNELRPGSSGSPQAYGTGEYETVPVDVVFRAIGYKGIAIPGVPYDRRTGTIPNQDGRVIDPDTGQPIPGEYVVGWAKRGPTGVIGTNKPDAVKTVQLLLEDVRTITPAAPETADPQAIVTYIRERQPKVVTYDEWQLLDRLETSKGQPLGRPRVKFTRVQDMLDAIAVCKLESSNGHHSTHAVQAVAQDSSGKEIEIHP